MAGRAPKNLAYREVRRRLIATGFEEVTRSGSHVKFVRTTSEGTRTAIVPKHREVAAGTLRSVLRQAGITPEAFAAL